MISYRIHCSQKRNGLSLTGSHNSSISNHIDTISRTLARLRALEFNVNSSLTTSSAVSVRSTTHCPDGLWWSDVPFTVADRDKSRWVIYCLEGAVFGHVDVAAEDRGDGEDIVGGV